MKRQVKRESAPGEPISVKKIRGNGGPGPSMKVPGDGAVATPVNGDFSIGANERNAAAHADTISGIFGGHAKPERVRSTTKPAF